MPNNQDSVLNQVRGFTWSSEESVAYEAAVEAINKAVGAYSALIADHEAAPEPDTAAISQILAAQHELAQRREQLDPTNHAQITRTRQEMTTLVEQLRTQRR